MKEQPEPVVPYIIRIWDQEDIYTYEVWHDYPRAELMVERIGEVPGVTNVNRDHQVRHGKHLYYYIDPRYDAEQVVGAVEAAVRDLLGIREADDDAQEEAPEEEEGVNG